MGEGNHLSATSSVGQPKGRWTWLVSGAAMAIVASGLLMQYVRGTVTKAAASEPQAGSARVGAPQKRVETLAKVGSESVTYDAVAEECVKRHGREVLDDLIHRLIILQACEKNNVTVSEQEISDEVGRIAKRFGLDVNQWLQMLQAERNVTPIQYRQNVVFPMIALRKLADQEVDISEEELKKAFIRNYGPRVKARMIMFDNQRRALDTFAALEKKPESFEELATTKSVDPSSRALGGQIPPIAKYNGNDQLEKAAFKLKLDEISGVIEVAPSRYVILRCEGRTESAVKDIEEVREALVDDLKEQKIQAAVATKFEELKRNTVVDNYLTQETNRPDRSAMPKDASRAVQPASATQNKANASPVKAADSSDAPAKPNRK